MVDPNRFVPTHPGLLDDVGVSAFGLHPNLPRYDRRAEVPWWSGPGLLGDWERGESAASKAATARLTLPSVRTDDELSMLRGTPAGMWPVGQGVVAEGNNISAPGRRILMENPFIKVRWFPSISGYTLRGGVTPGFERYLRERGIDISDTLPVPQGAIGRGQGIPTHLANNLNGQLAEQAVLAELRTTDPQARTQVSSADGRRRWDVVAELPGRSKTHRVNLHAESKNGDVRSNEHTRRQADYDGNMIAENRRVRAEGERLVQRGVPYHLGGRAVGALGVAGDMAEILGAYEADGHRLGENTGRAVAGVAGGNLSGLGGTIIGGTLGLPGGPFGVAGGAIAGGLGLGALGDFAGRWLFDNYDRRLSADEIPPSLSVPMP